MNVKQILKMKGSDAVETVAPDAPLVDAVRTLSEKRYGALVVCDADGSIAGILSERDIVRGMAESGPHALDGPVEQLMTRKVETCVPADDVNSVMERMTSGRFRHLPVLQDGRLAGVLSIGDVVKARIMEIEQENAAMADMLHG